MKGKHSKKNIRSLVYGWINEMKGEKDEKDINNDVGYYGRFSLC